MNSRRFPAPLTIEELDDAKLAKRWYWSKVMHCRLDSSRRHSSCWKLPKDSFYPHRPQVWLTSAKKLRVARFCPFASQTALYGRFTICITKWGNDER